MLLMNVESSTHLRKKDISLRAGHFIVIDSSFGLLSRSIFSSRCALGRGFFRFDLSFVTFFCERSQKLNICESAIFGQGKHLGWSCLLVHWNSPRQDQVS